MSPHQILKSWPETILTANGCFMPGGHTSADRIAIKKLAHPMPDCRWVLYARWAHICSRDGHCYETAAAGS